ncbi:MAG: hypothetical protein ACR2RL_25985, partial [Gammaproteobacteria bacterium]
TLPGLIEKLPSTNEPAQKSPDPEVRALEAIRVGARGERRDCLAGGGGCWRSPYVRRQLPLVS